MPRKSKKADTAPTPEMKPDEVAKLEPGEVEDPEAYAAALADGTVAEIEYVPVQWLHPSIKMRGKRRGEIVELPADSVEGYAKAKWCGPVPPPDPEVTDEGEPDGR